MGWKCFFGHNWIHYKKVNGTVKNINLTYFKFRRCSKCNKIQEMINPSYDFMNKHIEGQWMDIDESVLVAQKV